ncbi:hypothetical protein [Sulfitobacter sabulilitoris]|uniref:Uncharacterized protein n=1 Tax=Sulfitobacter sabulilitoris TaxID=2562655 RepID=A0A5S3PJ25_9RHOB|nr:hypothetical protein [Sulfitobacter sabulilitoris]TMM54398.1 hypothetical protein FDT80_02040 [Sulfitobacter sabulilitoris]
MSDAEKSAALNSLLAVLETLPGGQSVPSGLLIASGLVEHLAYENAEVLAPQDSAELILIAAKLDRAARRIQPG